MYISFVHEKFLEYSFSLDKIHFFYGESESGKTQLLQYLYHELGCASKSLKVNGSFVSKVDFDVCFLDFNSSVKSELKLTAKSRLKHEVAEMIAGVCEDYKEDLQGIEFALQRMFDVGSIDLLSNNNSLSGELKFDFSEILEKYVEFKVDHLNIDFLSRSKAFLELLKFKLNDVVVGKEYIIIIDDFGAGLGIKGYALLRELVDSFPSNVHFIVSKASGVYEEFNDNISFINNNHIHRHCFSDELIFELNKYNVVLSEAYFSRCYGQLIDYCIDVQNSEQIKENITKNVANFMYILYNEIT